MMKYLIHLVLDSLAQNERVGILVFDQNLNIRLCNGIASTYVNQKKDAINENILGYFRDMLLTCEVPNVCTVSIDNCIIKAEFYRVASSSEILTLIILVEKDKIDEVIEGARLNMQKNELLEKAVENLFEFFGMVDNNSKLIYLSKKTCAALDLNINEVRGKNVKEVLPDCLLHTVVNTGIPQLRYIYRHGKHSVPAMVIPITQKEEMEGAVCASIFKDVLDARQYLQNIHTLSGNQSKCQFRKIAGPKYCFKDIVGISEENERTKKIAKQIAASEATVLLLGETGTGKELYANAIHAASNRLKGPFIRVNCASIPENLLESELFGYEKGAFTGALRDGKLGKFELAHKGTIFLDEIGDMSCDVQAKMLRVLQEKEIERLGGTETFEVDVRVIAATNSNLLEMIDQGKFRKDLYYRLSIMILEIKPMRDRMVDIPVLVDHFISKINKRIKHNVKGVSWDTMQILMGYSWPGNIRELENVIEGSLLFCVSGEIKPENLPLSFIERISREKLKIKEQNNTINVYSDHDIGTIMNALKECNGNKRKASKLIGMPRSTFYYKLNKVRNKDLNS